jgi:hypothetical protein
MKPYLKTVITLYKRTTFKYVYLFYFIARSSTKPFKFQSETATEKYLKITTPIK